MGGVCFVVVESKNMPHHEPNTVRRTFQITIENDDRIQAECERRSATSGVWIAPALVVNEAISKMYPAAEHRNGRRKPVKRKARA